MVSMSSQLQTLRYSPQASSGMLNGYSTKPILNCVRCNLQGSKRCSVCKASYCSKACQLDDWYYHKEKCCPPPPLEDDILSNVRTIEYTSHGYPSLRNYCAPLSNRIEGGSICSENEVNSIYKISHEESQRPLFHSTSVVRDCDTLNGLPEGNTKQVARRITKKVDVISAKENELKIVNSVSNIIQDCVNRQTNFKDINKKLPVPSFCKQLGITDPFIESKIEPVVPIAFKGQVSNITSIRPENLTAIKAANIKGLTEPIHPNIDKLVDLNVSIQSTSSKAKIESKIGGQASVSNVEEIPYDCGKNSLPNVAPQFKVAGIYEGIITVWESVECFCLMTFNDSAQKVLCASLEEQTSGKPLTPFEVKKGDLVMAQSPADQAWYRALISAVLSEQYVEVVYIDFGNIERVTLLRNLPKCLQTSVIPGLALSASLIDSDSLVKPSELTCDSKIQFKVIGLDMECIRVVVLADKNDEAGIGTFLMTPCCLLKPKEESVESSATLIDTHFASPTEVRKPERTKILRDELKSLPVIIDREYGVIPTSWSEDLISVQIVSEENRKFLNKVTNFLTEFCSKAPQVTDCSLGEMICAFHPEDEAWYRGEVIGLDAEKALVCFVDFGNEDSVSLSHIRPFDPLLLSVPIMSLAVRPISNCSAEELRCLAKPLVESCQTVCMRATSLNPLTAVFKGISGEEILFQTTSCGEPSSPRLFKDCHRTSLPIGNGIEAVVLLCSNPLDIFLTAKTNMHLFEELDGICPAMNAWCNSSQEMHVPKEGEMCLARFQEDGLWYRATCFETEVETGSASVLFVDYGNRERVTFKDLRQMVDQFAALPVIAVRCRLKGINPEDMRRGDSKMLANFERALTPMSFHTINVLSKCERSLVYEIELPSLPLHALWQ